MTTHTQASVLAEFRTTLLDPSSGHVVFGYVDEKQMATALAEARNALTLTDAKVEAAEEARENYISERIDSRDNDRNAHTWLYAMRAALLAAGMQERGTLAATPPNDAQTERPQPSSENL